MKAYVFPGQGAQFPGMGKYLYEKSPVAKELFEKANSILGFRITDLMFEGNHLSLIWLPVIHLESCLRSLPIKPFHLRMD
jgi:[acyl-carrier-protein] S-malonyltransferase